MSTERHQDTSMQALVMSIEEACRAARISRTHLFRQINAGRLPIIKMGRRTLISEWALRAFLEQLERDSQVGAPGVHKAAAASVARRFGGGK